MKQLPAIGEIPMPFRRATACAVRRRIARL